MKLAENLSNFLPLEITVVNENYRYELNLFISKSEKYWEIIGVFSDFCVWVAL